MHKFLIENLLYRPKISCFESHIFSCYAYLLHIFVPRLYPKGDAGDKISSLVVIWSFSPVRSDKILRFEEFFCSFIPETEKINKQYSIDT